MMRTLMLMLTVLIGGVAAFTRYHPNATTTFDPAFLRRENVTPISSHPRQDSFYDFMAYLHIALVTAMSVATAVQVFRRKGDTIHVLTGTALQYITIIVVISSPALYVRHALLSSDTAFHNAPRILDPGHIFLFGVCWTTAWIHVLLVGRKQNLRFNGAGYWAVFGWNVLSLLNQLYAFFHMINNLLTLPRESYRWEINLEYLVLCTIFPIYDGVLMYGLWRWKKTDHLDWRGHHKVSGVIASSLVLSPWLLFIAHDARHFFKYPGLETPKRLMVQLVPQFILLGWNAKTILNYVLPQEGPKIKKDE